MSAGGVAGRRYCPTTPGARQKPDSSASYWKVKSDLCSMPMQPVIGTGNNPGNARAPVQRNAEKGVWVQSTAYSA